VESNAWRWSELAGEGLDGDALPLGVDREVELLVVAPAEGADGLDGEDDRVALTVGYFDELADVAFGCFSSSHTN